MPSKVTTILPVRVDRLLIARLDELRGLVPDSTRTALARDALRLGLELLEAQLKGQGEPKACGPGKPPGAVQDRLSPQSGGLAEGAPRKSRGVLVPRARAKGRPRPQSVQVLDSFEAEPARASPSPSAAAPPEPDQRPSLSAAAPARAGPQAAGPRGALRSSPATCLIRPSTAPAGWVSSERLFISHAWRAYRKAHPSRPVVSRRVQDAADAGQGQGALGAGRGRDGRSFTAAPTSRARPASLGAQGSTC